MVGFGGTVTHFTRPMIAWKQQQKPTATQAFLCTFISDLLRVLMKLGQYYGHEQHTYHRKLNIVFAIRS